MLKKFCHLNNCVYVIVVQFNYCVEFIWLCPVQNKVMMLAFLLDPSTLIFVAQIMPCLGVGSLSLVEDGD